MCMANIMTQLLVITAMDDWLTCCFGFMALSIVFQTYSHNDLETLLFEITDGVLPSWLVIYRT